MFDLDKLQAALQRATLTARGKVQGNTDATGREFNMLEEYIWHHLNRMISDARKEPDTLPPGGPLSIGDAIGNRLPEKTEPPLTPVQLAENAKATQHLIFIEDPVERVKAILAAEPYYLRPGDKRAIQTLLNRYIETEKVTGT